VTLSFAELGLAPDSALTDASRAWLSQFVAPTTLANGAIVWPLRDLPSTVRAVLLQMAQSRRAEVTA